MKLALNHKLSPLSAGALIVLALLASIGISREAREPAKVAAPVAAADVPRAPGSERTTTAALDIDLEKLSRPARQGAVTELFAVRAALPVGGGNGGNGEPGAPAVPAGPPALPFQYLGKLIEPGRMKVFLGKDSQLYTVMAGQTLENLYKVERVTEEAVTFTYLPMGISQTLPIPARS